MKFWHAVTWYWIVLAKKSSSSSKKFRSPNCNTQRAWVWGSASTILGISINVWVSVPRTGCAPLCQQIRMKDGRYLVFPRGVCSTSKLDPAHLTQIGLWGEFYRDRQSTVLDGQGHLGKDKCGDPSFQRIFPWTPWNSADSSNHHYIEHSPSGTILPSSSLNILDTFPRLWFCLWCVLFLKYLALKWSTWLLSNAPPFPTHTLCSNLCSHHKRSLFWPTIIT